MTKNIVNANVQGTETSVNSFKFEVGKTYRQNGVEFKVLERKGRKVKIEYTKSVNIGEIFLKGKIENKTIKVAEGNGLYIEFLSWAWGYRRLLGTEVNAEHVVEEEYKEELRETLQEMYEHLREAASLGSDADDIFYDLGEENEDIQYITGTLYDALDMLKNLVKQQQNKVA